MRAQNATRKLNLGDVNQPIKSGIEPTVESPSAFEDVAVVALPSSRERKAIMKAGELKKTARIVFVQTCVASRKIFSALDEQVTGSDQPEVA
jgi:hypothetical protein